MHATSQDPQQPAPAPAPKPVPGSDLYSYWVRKRRAEQAAPTGPERLAS